MTDPPAAPLGFADLPEELRARIEAELAPGERLLWAVQPDPNRPRGPRRARLSAWVWLAGWVVLGLSACSGLWLLPDRFATSWPSLIVVMVASGCGATLMATYLLSAATFEASWRLRARFELYALTDRRALIWSPAAESNAVAVRQILPGTIRGATVERVEYPNGSGNLTFKPGCDDLDQDGFFGVAEVRRVDDLLRHVLAHPAPNTPAQPFSPTDEYEEPF